MTKPLTIDPSAVLWSAPPAERAGRPLLVLLHGYGSNEQDLFGLAEYLPADPVIASLRAPLSPPWPAPGHSWYPIGGLDGRDPGALTAAAEAVLAWADEHAADAASIAFLGFSQGGAMSLQLLRLAPERVAFAVNLSGYAAGGALPGDAILAETRPPVFWGRGSADEVIRAHGRVAPRAQRTHRAHLSRHGALGLARRADRSASLPHVAVRRAHHRGSRFLTGKSQLSAPLCQRGAGGW